jgi:hypothetical protein
MVFRWVFIPWIQAELDHTLHGWNTADKRADKNKILPHGIPQLIYEHPEMFGTENQGVRIEQSLRR